VRGLSFLGTTLWGGTKKRKFSGILTGAENVRSQPRRGLAKAGWSGGARGPQHSSPPPTKGDLKDLYSQGG